MIYSIKRIGDIISKIIFHLSISTNILLYYFEFFFKKKKNLGAFDWYYSIIIIIFEVKDIVFFFQVDRKSVV